MDKLTGWEHDSDDGMDVEGPLVGWMLPRVLTADDRVTLNLTEDDSAITMTMGLPGFDLERATVCVEGAFLHVRAVDALDEDDVVVRTLRMSTLVDVEHIEARLVGTILTVTLPKTHAPPRNVPIQR